MNGSLARLVLCICLIPALCACVLRGPPGTPVALAAKRPEGMGQLVFVRGTHYGHALSPYYLFVDGDDESNCVGSLLSSDFFAIPLGPGTHHLRMARIFDNQVFWAEQVLPLEVEAGREYYVQGGKPHWLSTKQIPRLRLLDAETGESLVTSARRGKSEINGAGDCSPPEKYPWKQRQ